MKRLKSSDEVNSNEGEKGVLKGRKDDDLNMQRSLSHRSFYYKSESGKKGLSSSSSHNDRAEGGRESSMSIRKRPEHDSDSYDRRKSYDRYRDSNGGYTADRIHRSESFSGPRRDFPKGFRSERDRSHREGSVSSWRRIGGGKDVDEGTKSGGDSARGNKIMLEEMDQVNSSNGVRDTKSPPYSKDSGSEQSKSLELKKTVNNIEMEEGELEPDPEPDPEPDNGHRENSVDSKHLVDGAKLIPEEERKPDQTCNLEDKAKFEENKMVGNLTKKVEKSSNSQDSSTQRSGDNEVAIEFSLDNERKKDAEPTQDDNFCENEASDALAGNLKPLKDIPKLSNDTYLEVNGDNMHVLQSFVTKELTENFNDKGKRVAALQDDSRIENESKSILSANDMEGPSTRGFELFLSDPVKKPGNVDQTEVNTPKDEKLSFEPLELSLSLPNVLLPIGFQNSGDREMSIQSPASSFRTSSDGSFSGSQHFTHNPSCSMTHDSYDFEQSVGSRPLFQGVAWQVQSSDEQKDGELPVHHKSLLNGNVTSHQSQRSHGISNGQTVELQSIRAVEGSSKLPIQLARQPSGSHSRHLDESPSQSVGSRETRSDYHKDRKRGARESIGILTKDSSKNEKEKLLSSSANMVEPLLQMIVSEPLHVVARKLNEMTGQSLARLKDSVRDVILNPNKQRQLSSFQKTLANRLDITLEMLLKAHSAHIEILVALKTGIQDFLQANYEISASDLAEIFLNLRCRNLTCRSYLPVDECDCKVCGRKNGFCSACMCLICSKFDMASNTCSWVGCDVCLHWCHTDCGLRESYIRNGRSEMQFHCVACDHPSEMFGFVREVFQNFAKEWTAETLLNEIEYIRRIFNASEDIRGKSLHEIAIQMLSRLSNKADLQQVRSYIMGFLTESESFKWDNTHQTTQKEPSKPNQGESSNGTPRTSQEAAFFMKSIYQEKQPPLMASPATPKEPIFDELDGIVRIKLAEAKMFQTRADDARREAEGLKRIAVEKNKKIEQEFANRITKLHFSEAEETRKQKFEELQAFENAHQSYCSMKVRMERDIRDLLVKMEATKRNFGS